MSDVPQAPIDLPYAEPRPQDFRNGVATTALVLGIIGLVGCPFLAPVALILGIVGLVRANQAPPYYPGRGVAIAGLVMGILGLVVVPLMLAAVVFPSMMRAQQTTKRVVCAANLRGIGQGLKVYAFDNAGVFPIAPFAPPEPDGSDNDTNVAFIGMMSENAYASPGSWQLDKTHPSQSLFLLVIDGTCTTQQFICPSSADIADALWIAAGGPPTPGQPGINRFDFLGYPYLSYGYQLPFGRFGQPGEDLDPRMAIAADKGPYFTAGAPASDGRIPDAAIGIPGTRITMPAISSPAALLAEPAAAWRLFNSPNHNGEGQNVLFLDGSVSFEKTPRVGVDYDNIYTMQGGYTPLDVMLGLRPSDYYGPLTNTDSVIVP